MEILVFFFLSKKSYSRDKGYNFCVLPGIWTHKFSIVNYQLSYRSIVDPTNVNYALVWRAYKKLNWAHFGATKKCEIHLTAYWFKTGHIIYAIYRRGETSNLHILKGLNCTTTMISWCSFGTIKNWTKAHIVSISSLTMPLHNLKKPMKYFLQIVLQQNRSSTPDAKSSWN